MEISFLLFSSMLQPTEQYLSREIKDKPISKNTIQNLKSAISNAIGKKKGLFRKKAAVDDSIDHEIEMAIANVKNPKEEAMINNLLAEEITKTPEVFKYETQAKETSKEIKSAFKSLYQTFVGYAKGAYTRIKSEGRNISYASKKIIEGPVRMTLAKFIKVFEYIQAAINPQWNMPMLSKMDYDTLSPAVTNHIVIDKENFQYDSGYITLRYRDQ